MLQFKARNNVEIKYFVSSHRAKNLPKQLACNGRQKFSCWYREKKENGRSSKRFVRYPAI